MADIYGSHFQYGGISSRQKRLIFANAESSRFTPISGSTSGVTVFNKKNLRRYLVDTDYADSAISFEVDIVTDDDSCLALSERREIERWLFNRHVYKKLYIDPDDDCDDEMYETINGEQKGLYLNCIFRNPEKLEYNGGIVGYRVTLESDSNMWFQDPVSVTLERNSPGDTFFVDTVTVDTDIDGYTYPTVVINVGERGGTISISNASDEPDRYTTLTGIPSNAIIRLNSELNMINDDYYAKLYHQIFPRLLNGINRIYVNGDVSSIVYTFNNRRNF